MTKVSISDLLDNVEAPAIDLPQHDVSSDRVKETVMSQIHENPKHMFKPRRNVAAILIAAVLTMALGTAAFAAVNHSGFFRNVFGTGVEGQEAHDVVLSDGEGEGLPKTEHQPAVERVDVDETAAEELVGGAVSDVAQVVELGGYAFTVESAVFDDNGIGMVTVAVENPDGLNLSSVMNGVDVSDLDAPEFGYALLTSSDSGHMDDRSMLVADSVSDTRAEFVIYAVPVGDVRLDQGIDLEFFLPSEESGIGDAATVHLDAAQRVEARTFTADDGMASASVSPLGMVLRYENPDGGEPVEDVIELVYADGSSYVVKGDDLVNYTVACWWDESFQDVSYAFNRLVDTENLVEVHVAGHISGLTEDPADGPQFDYTLR